MATKSSVCNLRLAVSSDELLRSSSAHSTSSPRLRRAPFNRRGLSTRRGTHSPGIARRFRFGGVTDRCSMPIWGGTARWSVPIWGGTARWSVPIWGGTAPWSVPILVGTDRWSVRTSGINERRPAAGTTIRARMTLSGAVVGSTDRRLVPILVGTDRWSVRTSGINERRPAAGTTIRARMTLSGAATNRPTPKPPPRMTVSAAHGKLPR